MSENHDHSRFIGIPYWYDGHRTDPGDLDLKAYIDERISEAGGGGSSYLVYTALIRQSGTSAPIATELQNTLGVINYAYTNVGVYTLTSAGLFTTSKTVIFFGLSNSNQNFIPFYYLYGAGNSIDISTVLLDGTYQNGLMFETSIEIRVYP